MTNNVDTQVNSASDPNQLSFMSALPSEIILKIFSHINQRDCLTCMAVCRGWYSTIPQHTQRVWECVRINQRNANMVNRRRKRCLGEHVKKVAFLHLPDENQLYNAMQTLYECNCTNIKTIAFIRCATGNQDAFIPLLQQLAPHVTKIEMLRHRSNVSFLHLLNVCPSLTHFSFQAATDDNHGLYDKEPELRELTILRDQFPSVVYLRFNSIMDERMRIEPILKRCPNLCSFIGAEYETYEAAEDLGVGTNPVYIRLEELLTWCPRIAYIQTTSASRYYSSTIQHSISGFAYDNSIDTNGENCLRQLETSSNYGHDQITQLLTENQQTLEYVSLGSHGENFNWSTTLRSISLTQLHTLAFYDLKLDAATLIILLNHCPMIATLVVRDTRLVFDHSSLGLMNPINHLRTLELTDAIFGDGHAIGIFIDHLPALEVLHILSSSIPLAFFTSIHHLKRMHLSDIQWTLPNSNSSYEEAVVQFFPQPLPSKLEILRIRSTGITYDLLRQIVNSKSLQEIHVQLDRTLCKDDDSGLCRLANALKETPIDTLRLYDVRHLTFAALKALSDIPRLARFTTNWVAQNDNDLIITQVDKTGLVQLVRKRTSLRNIRLTDVILVDNGNTVAYEEVIKEIQQEHSCYASCYNDYGPLLTQNTEAKSILIRRTNGV